MYLALGTALTITEVVVPSCNSCCWGLGVLVERLVRRSVEAEQNWQLCFEPETPWGASWWFLDSSSRTRTDTEEPSVTHVAAEGSHSACMWLETWWGEGCCCGRSLVLRVTSFWDTTVCQAAGAAGASVPQGCSVPQSFLRPAFWLLQQLGSARAHVSSCSAQPVAGQLSVLGRPPASASGAANPGTRVVLLLLPQAVQVGCVWLEESCWNTSYITRPGEKAILYWFPAPVNLLQSNRQVFWSHLLQILPEFCRNWILF